MSIIEVFPPRHGWHEASGAVRPVGCRVFVTATASHRVVVVDRMSGTTTGGGSRGAGSDGD
ncbi:hypothetical protein ACLQ24_24195 [Micromonospora sp. DT4]|uniref:hypothetical protein n=1 Tax=Micromonospora sp. DT4 TaxID=3393438 RepID=UPI003CF3A417